MNQTINDFEHIRRFTGLPGEFWPAFLEKCTRLAAARIGFLLVREGADGSWKNFCFWPGDAREVIKTSGFGSRIEEISADSARDGYAWETAGQEKSVGTGSGIILGVRLVLGDEERVGVAVFVFDNTEGVFPEEVILRLKLVADTPAIYQSGRLLRQSRADVVQFAEALDLMVLLNAEKRYMAAAMTFCNEVASRYRCACVSLGWLKDGYIRVQAISHMERFEKKMDVVQILEAAMEEAFDQDEEIVLPQPKDSTAVVRDHEAFSRDQGAQYMVSLPIRLDGEPVGVLFCERAKEAFSEIDIRGLRVLCDQAARRLGDLKRNDRWFGARMATLARETLSRFLGIEHTFAKFMGILACVILAIFLFGHWNYRVEAPFILKTDDLAFQPAPFDGYIADVHVDVGDLVDEGELLLTLDTRELLLEESTAIANQVRYSREAEKARAENALAEMKIAQALADQAKAQLGLVRYHLNNAGIRAPFPGIVVEGDLKEMLGAPVRKGDVLFKVAMIQKMYAELDIDERDVHEVAAGRTGEIAFVSRPDLKFTVKIERIEPVSVAKEDGNVFITRSLFTGEVADWWRPGMSGVAKVNVGKRNIMWIFTHRTVDFLRLLLWW
ncbi:MAG: efflux RND transporter periplasmic adaptor subunit [Thermodesulfobacteriota bacterium]|nr:efflux RND transporter periplasmic adaptor subunit [Thermodesulfobacteriota bacterium]